MSDPKCRTCGAPPTEAVIFGESGIGERVLSYDPAGGGYHTDDSDPADYAPVDYVECQSCGERADDIHQLMGVSIE
jgi:hypothetical protein